MSSSSITIFMAENISSDSVMLLYRYRKVFYHLSHGFMDRIRTYAFYHAQPFQQGSRQYQALRC